MDKDFKLIFAVLSAFVVGYIEGVAPSLALTVFGAALIGFIYDFARK